MLALVVQTTAQLVRTVRCPGGSWMFAFEYHRVAVPRFYLVRDLALPCPLSVSACRLVGLVWVGASAWSWIFWSGFVSCGALA